MKKSTIIPERLAVWFPFLTGGVVFLVAFLVWYLVYPETLARIEAHSFFMWSEDYFALKRHQPGGYFTLVTDYFSQFYRWREVGALIQAVQVLAVWVVFYFIIKKWGGNRYSWLALLAVGGWLFFILVNPTAREQEKRAAIEQAAIAGNWNYILNKVTPQEATSNPVYSRYIMLALSETGQLPDNLFKLSPVSSDCFYFGRDKEPAGKRFNSIFYASLGIYNEAIRQAFEASLQCENGTDFHCIRSLAMWYLRMGNIELAEKYLTVLSRTSCHNSWINNRLILLETLHNKPIVTPDKSRHDIFMGGPFTIEMASLLEQDPTNDKLTHYFFCALLLDKEPENFAEAFYSLPYRTKHPKVPVIYEQALAIAASRHPDKYGPVSAPTAQAYNEFLQLKATNNIQLLESKFRHTYWWYYHN